MLANYSCLLFDLDGTLLDFNAAEQQAITGTLQAAGLPAGEQAAALFASINAELWQRMERGEIKKDKLVIRRFAQLLEQLGAEGDAIRLNNDYMTRLSATAVMIPGADETLRELAEFATLAVVTNGTYRVQVARLEKSGLLPFFDEVFVSDRMGAPKPAPKIFTEALKRLGVVNRQRVLVVGDSLTADIKGGQNAGLDTCWMNLNGAENTTGIQPTHTILGFAQLKLVAVGEDALKFAATREKRHTV